MGGSLVAAEIGGVFVLQPFYHSQHLLLLKIAHHHKTHIVGNVALVHVGADVIGSNLLERGGCTQDGAGKRMTLEKELLVVLENEVGRVVQAHIDFVGNHVLLFLQLILFKKRCEDYLKGEIYRLGDVFLEYCAIYHRLLFGGVGVKVAAQLLQSVVDAPGRAFFAAAEYHMLCQVGQSVLVLRLVGRARLDAEGAVGHGRIGLLEGDFEPARERKNIILHNLFFHGAKLIIFRIFVRYGTVHSIGKKIQACHL